MEQLFSYGTLRDEKVQRAVFGRTVAGRPDAIIGCRLEPVSITDQKSIAISGTAKSAGKTRAYMSAAASAKIASMARPLTG